MKDKEPTNKIREVAPAKTEELRVDGLSLLFFDYYKINGASKADTTKGAPIITTHDYLQMFDLSIDEAKQQRFCMYTPHIPLPALNLTDGGPIQGTARLLFRVFDESFAVTITVINVDCSKSLGSLLDAQLKLPVLATKRALTTDDILQIIRELNQPNEGHFETLREQRRQALEAIFGAGMVEPHAENRSRKNVGIQIWSIENPVTARSGLDLSELFGWEITALLECGSDLILNERDAWRSRRQDQVEALLGRGTDILADHRALIHRSVCLEISRVRVPRVRPRSVNRLMAFGFDSTSLYLAYLAAAQECLLIATNEKLSAIMKGLQQLIDQSPLDNAGIRKQLEELLRIRISLSSALDHVLWITSRMREARHVDFFNDTIASWGLDSIRAEVDEKIRSLSEVASQALQLK